MDDSIIIKKFITLVEMYCPNVEGLEFVSLVLEEPSLQFETGVSAFLEKLSPHLRSIHLNAHSRDD